MVTVIVVAHLSLAAVWLGAMVYSLGVVQPRVDRFFPDAERREEFLLALASGNRWPVTGLITALVLTDAAVLLLRPGLRAGYAAALVLYLLAAAVFAHVSWRHWPARVFALPEDLPRHQHRLRRLARTLLALVGAAFLAALIATAAGS